MEQLREKVARAIRDKVRAHQWTQGLFELEHVESAATAILGIPEIRDALAEQRINAMSPAQFGEKLLAPDMSNYDNPRKQDRRYKKPD